LSYGIILLRLWVCYLIIIARSKIFNKNNYYNIFLLIVLFLIILLFLTFRVSNFFIFYLFFERSLIPTLLLILGWGYQPERIQAGLYLLFYTLFASLPLLIGIFYLFNRLNLINFLMFNFLLNYHFIYLCLVLAFLVKIPIFIVHL
jgi:NADH-ubiquinone oxidoreductase chain 4